MYMALGHISPIHRNLKTKIQIKAPRKLLWTSARFCVDLGLILALFGSRNADAFLCLWKYSGRAPTQESHGLSQASAETCKAVTREPT